MSASLALRGDAPLPKTLANAAPRFGNGSQALMQSATGNVAVVFALERYDRRQHVAIYSLRVYNESSSVLVCRIGVLSNNGDLSLAYPVPVTVEPFSVRSAEVPVWQRDFDSFSQAVAEVAGDGMRCVVEACAPAPKAKPNVSYLTAAGIAMAAGIAALVVAGIGMAMPRAAAPAPAVPVAHAAPRAVASALHTARIASIAVDPIVAKPGQTIDVAYDASGDGGYLRLLGTDGTIWAQQPFSHNGTAAFTLPAFPTKRELHVLLHVTQGRSSAESSAGLIVLPTAMSTAAGSQPAVPVAGDDPDSAADNYANGTFQVLTPTVSSGGTIRIEIISPRNAMRISLADSQSHELTGINVGADQQTVTLRAPSVKLATRYTIVASFTDGFGQESIVQPVAVTP